MLETKAKYYEDILCGKKIAGKTIMIFKFKFYCSWLGKVEISSTSTLLDGQESLEKKIKKKG